MSFALFCVIHRFLIFYFAALLSFFFFFCFFIFMCVLFFFFFSSRRRHTRSLRDWSSDVCSSDLAVEIGKALGQSFVVDNKTGANGNIGMEIAAKAAPDGYTLIMTSSALAINPRSEEHTSELQSRRDLVCRLLLEKKKYNLLIVII